MFLVKTRLTAHVQVKMNWLESSWLPKKDSSQFVQCWVLAVPYSWKAATEVMQWCHLTCHFHQDHTSSMLGPSQGKEINLGKVPLPTKIHSGTGSQNFICHNTGSWWNGHWVAGCSKRFSEGFGVLTIGWSMLRWRAWVLWTVDTTFCSMVKLSISFSSD